MERIGPLIGIGAVALVLIGVLWIVQTRRAIEIPEGFTTEISADIDDLGNPITKIIKKVGALSLRFADPELWKTTIATSKLSFTDLARRQIEADRVRDDKIAE
jgi:hypothetical protein